MLSKNSYGSFDERPEYKAEQALLYLLFPFLIEIIERLLHGFPKPLPEPSWIEAEEFLVEGMNCALVRHHSWSSVNIRGLTVASTSLRLDEAGLRLFQAHAFLPARLSTTGFPARCSPSPRMSRHASRCLAVDTQIVMKSLPPNTARSIGGEGGGMSNQPIRSAPAPTPGSAMLSRSCQPRGGPHNQDSR